MLIMFVFKTRMKLLVTLLPLMLIVGRTSSSPQTCKVTKAGAVEQCVFPYKVEGQLFTECSHVNLTGTRVGWKPVARCPISLLDYNSLEASTDLSSWAACQKPCPLTSYRNNKEMQEDLLSLSNTAPDIAVPFVIGTSASGLPLVGLRVTQDVKRDRPLLKPMVRLMANIHGNEALGREVIFNLARHLVLGFGVDPRVTRLIRETDISLLPSINPDGFEAATPGSCSGIGKKAGMFNSGDKDLNQDFPTVEDLRKFQVDYSYDPFKGRQPETQAMMEWSADNPFVLSASLHDGAELVTFPFDHQKEGRQVGEENLTPDNDLFNHLATSYSRTHPSMADSRCFRRSETGGVSNGAKWHELNTGGPLRGSMQDFSYLFTSNLELSLHLSCCKFPPAYFLVREWEANREGLLSFLEQVHQGVKGVVLNEQGIPQGGVDIVTWGPSGDRRGRNVTTSERGEFWKVLLPGRSGINTYTLQAQWSDCEPGGSGRVFASLRYRVIVSYRRPLKVQDMFLRQIGFCGIPEVPRHSPSVLEELGVSPPGVGVSPVEQGELKVTSKLAEPIDKTAEVEDEEMEVVTSPPELKVGLEQEEPDITTIAKEQQGIPIEEKGPIGELGNTSKPEDEDLGNILVEPLEEDMGDSLETLDEDPRDIVQPLEEDLGDILESLEKDQRDILESLEDDQRDILESLEDDLGDLLEYLEDDLGNLLKPPEKDQKNKPMDDEKLEKDSENQTNANINIEIEESGNFKTVDILGDSLTTFSDEETVTDNVLDESDNNNSNSRNEEVDTDVKDELEPETPKR